MDNISRKPVKRKSVFLGAVLPFIAIFIIGILSGVAVAMLEEGYVTEPLWMMAAAAAVAIITLVIAIVVWSGVVKGINEICKDDGEHLIPYICAILLSLVTLGIYGLYYTYKIQKRLYLASERLNADVKVKPSTVLIWCIIGIFVYVGILIADVIVIKSYNKLVEAYNEQGEHLQEEHPEPQQEVNLDEPQQGMLQDATEEARELSLQTEQPAMLENPASGVMRCIAGIDEAPEIRFDINRNRATLGRKPSLADVVILNERVSKVHCDVVLDIEKGIFYVTDRNSTNGIRIKTGEGITKPEPETLVALAEGDQLILPDNITFEFEVYK